MSGDAFNRNYSRKDFLKLGAVALGASYLYACTNRTSNPIAVHTIGANSKTGHLLREKKFPAPSRTIAIDTVIVGGGVSGLSAARYLKKNNFEDFVLLELDVDTGGNAKGGKNKISAYPYGAHYLSLPNEKFTDLIDFLAEHKIISGFDNNGLPVYDEYYLCGEPQERLYYKGIWQEGLPPKHGMSMEENAELDRFIGITEQYRKETGTDGKPAFTIPAEWSSDDGRYLELDELSMFDFLKKLQFKTDFLFWFVNYCCKDDFGCDLHTTSAWAGMHYFCSRNGKSANAHAYEQLTWPEGNYFLINALRKDILKHIQTEQLVYNIIPHNEQWQCYVFDVKTNTCTLYVCKRVIMATPQFVNKRLLNFDHGLSFNEFNYYPWLVANVTIKDKKELNGSNELAWDNVFYTSKSLGYVNACHQLTDRSQSKTVITFYYNFSEKNAKAEREALYQQKEDFWKKLIIDDLKIAHPKIEEWIEEIELYTYGHGMISPTVGLRTSSNRKKLEEGLNHLYFVNSDVSGLSIFEEAFYRGICASKKILEQHAQKS
ncbi:MAG TPA: FAD/NAD(P)-binding protein [Bacteroidia bacterium]|jgi:hypothetical protein|nr:FAD/NAD(P)-binding protein [Bacteroidia bacterium]